MNGFAHHMTKVGTAIILSAALLLVLGLASIYVTDTHYASGHDGPANAARQLLYVLAAILSAALVIRLGYYNLLRHAYVIFLVATLALVPLFVARLTDSTCGGLTPPRNGAYRWIQLPGFQVQPSEFVKIAFIMALAWYLRYRKNYRRLTGLMVPFLISSIPLTLILLEPDLGTVVLMAPVLFLMLFMAGARWRHLTLIALMGVAALPFAWGQIKGYQRARVTAVMLQSEQLRRDVIADPEQFKWLATRRQALEWAASSGYQLVHSKNAIGSGGVLGQGWGRGVYVTSTLLPDRHNDFIFALIAHQWGFAGALLAILCYAVIVVAGARIASATTEPAGRLLAIGLVSLLALQAMVNIGMSLGLMPITGMTLPFVSHGGSSLLSGAVALALLVSVSQHRPYLLGMSPFEFTSNDTVPTHPAEQRSTVPGEIAPWSPTRTAISSPPNGPMSAGAQRRVVQPQPVE